MFIAINIDDNGKYEIQIDHEALVELIRHGKTQFQSKLIRVEE